MIANGGSLLQRRLLGDCAKWQERYVHLHTSETAAASPSTLISGSSHAPFSFCTTVASLLVSHMLLPTPAPPTLSAAPPLPLGFARPATAAPSLPLKPPLAGVSHAPPPTAASTNPGGHPRSSVSCRTAKTAGPALSPKRTHARSARQTAATAAGGGLRAAGAAPREGRQARTEGRSIRSCSAHGVVGCLA